MNAVDINNLQQQIDALEQNLADTQSALTSTIQFLEQQIADRIGSIRWYPKSSAAPAGWVSVDGQRIALGANPLPDEQLLYERVPASWRDGDDVLLPDAIDILPISATRDSLNVAFPMGDGDTRDYWLYENQQTDTRNINAVRGRWMIYIGGAQIS